MGNIFQSLKNYVFRRRDHVGAAAHGQADHPERLPPNKMSSTQDTPENMTSTITTEVLIPTNVCSDIYMACRHNKLVEVQRLLENMTLDEVDRVEVNGSTALHTASYHGHYEVVKVLLKAGADRAIANQYQCLPFDEARNDDIKELFLRSPNSNRFVSSTGSIAWELMDEDVLEKAMEERQIIKSSYDNVTGTTSVEKMFEKIEKNYITKGLTTIDGIEHIRRYFQKATQERDPQWIIKAYTAETDFYKVLNTEIAAGASQYQNERRYIIALLTHHPLLEKLSFIGTAYRVVCINHDTLEKYRVDYLLMTKSFLSSSIDRKVAEMFLCRQESAQSQYGTMERTKVTGKVIKSWVVCKYDIRHQRTGLYIENSSQYANEGEILIMPYSVFKVKKVQQVKASFLPDDRLMTEIELQECDQYLQV